MDYSYTVIRHRKIRLEIYPCWAIFHCCSPRVTPSFAGFLLQSTCHMPIRPLASAAVAALQARVTVVHQYARHVAASVSPASSQQPSSNHNAPRHPVEENVNVDTLRNVEVNVDTPVENYCCETTQGLEVLQIESDISIAQNDDDEAAIEIGVISERPEEPQIESKEDQPLVLVKPPTLPCIFVKPYTGVEVKERLQIFYTADTFVLDDHDMTDSFVLEVPNELPILKEGVHAALLKYIDASFVVDISK
ncbi:hypothetical protein Scep_011045 [Stephania cephalantha]|uniref:Uncharacterized protein n=1 Tax=Stephania cephalantha TaxID=152367 RepID=A0AAP0JX17_9MAGN